MIFKSYINKQFINSRRNSQTLIYNTSEHKNKLQTTFLNNKIPIKLLNSKSLKLYRPIQKNYINYTIITNNIEHNYKFTTLKENDTLKKNTKTLRIVNDHLKYFSKNKLNNNDSNRIIFNHKNYTYRTNYGKNNLNKIVFKKINKLIYDIKQDKDEIVSQINDTNMNESSKSDIYNMLKFEKLNFAHKLHKNSGVPINKRIKLLKEARNSINQLQKNSFNYPMIKTQRLETINPYNDISNKKPIIIKLFQKPKLNVPKFININFSKENKY